MPADPVAIKAQVVGAMATRANLEVLTAGREVVQHSSKRWRRVADSDPCGWCAMLAGRGPVYRSAEKAGDGHRYHGHCGCTAEPFEGDPDSWEPTPGEQHFIDAYESVHQPGMSAEDVAAKMREWMDDPANALKAEVRYSIDALDDDAADALLSKLADDGDWEGAERVSELIDARIADRPAAMPKLWAPDPHDAFNPQTFDWYEALPEDEQYAFLDKMRDASRFQENQWAHINAGTAPKRAPIPTERQIRAEWDAYVESEWVRLEEATNGVVLSREAAAAGHTARDLLRVNAKTARKWASEETRRYWDDNGRLTYDAFRAGYTGDTGALESARQGFWA